MNGIKPKLTLLVGINGAGKTTFYYEQLKPLIKAPFINADEIQKEQWPGEVNNPERSYEAAKIADRQRNTHIQEKKSFVAETVFSHPSKVDLIKKAQENGFNVTLFHIHVSNPELAVSRVENRTIQGGHNVPEDKIKERFPRTLTYLKDAINLADKTHIFDNSEIGKRHRHLMTLEHGKVIKLSNNLPEWAHEQYGKEISEYQQINRSQVKEPAAKYNVSEVKISNNISATEREYQIHIDSFIKNKYQQIERIEAKISERKEQAIEKLSDLEKKEPGLFSLPSTKKAWQVDYKKAEGRVNKLGKQIDQIQAQKQSGFLEDKLTHLAAQKVQKHHPSLAKEFKQQQLKKAQKKAQALNQAQKKNEKKNQINR